MLLLSQTNYNNCQRPLKMCLSTVTPTQWHTEATTAKWTVCYRIERDKIQRVSGKIVKICQGLSSRFEPRGLSVTCVYTTVRESRRNHKKRRMEFSFRPRQAELMSKPFLTGSCLRPQPEGVFVRKGWLARTLEKLCSVYSPLVTSVGGLSRLHLDSSTELTSDLHPPKVTQLFASKNSKIRLS